jgi:hypothetical protein
LVWTTGHSLSFAAMGSEMNQTLQHNSQSNPHCCVENLESISR